MASAVNEDKTSMKDISTTTIIETLQAVNEYLENPCPESEAKYVRSWDKLKTVEKRTKKNKTK